jgi:hypothetical protein
MSPLDKDRFDRDGYTVARALFAPPEVEHLRDHYMTLRRRGSYADDLVGVQPDSRDPLRRYPRMAQMHRWDGTSLHWLLEPRLARELETLLGKPPYAV